MTIQLFVADGAWDIAQVVSATRAGSNVVYEALIPWVFLAGFGMLVYEAFKVYQGSTASITGALLRIGVAVGLLTNFHTWTGEIGSAINGMVQEIGGGNGQDQLMADYAAVLQNPGKNDQSTTTPVVEFHCPSWRISRGPNDASNALAAGGDRICALLADATIAAVPVIDDDCRSAGFHRPLDAHRNEEHRDAVFSDFDEPGVLASGLGVRKYCYEADVVGGEQHGRRLAHDRKHRVRRRWFVDRDQRSVLAARDLQSTYWRGEPCTELDVPVPIACCDRGTTDNEYRDNRCERR